MPVTPKHVDDEAQVNYPPVRKMAIIQYHVGTIHSLLFFLLNSFQWVTFSSTGGDSSGSINSRTRPAGTFLEKLAEKLIKKQDSELGGAKEGSTEIGTTKPVKVKGRRGKKGKRPSKIGTASFMSEESSSEEEEAQVKGLQDKEEKTNIVMGSQMESSQVESAISSSLGQETSLPGRVEKPQNHRSILGGPEQEDYLFKSPLRSAPPSPARIANANHSAAPSDSSVVESHLPAPAKPLPGSGHSLGHLSLASIPLPDYTPRSVVKS